MRGLVTLTLAALLPDPALAQVAQAADPGRAVAVLGTGLVALAALVALAWMRRRMMAAQASADRAERRVARVSALLGGAPGEGCLLLPDGSVETTPGFALVLGLAETADAGQIRAALGAATALLEDLAPGARTNVTLPLSPGGTTVRLALARGRGDAPADTLWILPCHTHEHETPP